MTQADHALPVIAHLDLFEASATQALSTMCSVSEDRGPDSLKAQETAEGVQ